MGSKHTKKGHFKKGENMFTDKWIHRKNDKLQRMKRWKDQRIVYEKRGNITPLRRTAIVWQMSFFGMILYVKRTKNNVERE